jgi:carbonic anhydrase
MSFYRVSIMPEIKIRRTTQLENQPPLPADAAEAARRLQDGNQLFAKLFDGTSEPEIPPIVIHVADGDEAQPQRPFAAVLGCADARVPVEIVFHRLGTDLFIVRVAGNVPGSECIGSFEYAAANLAETLRLAVVLGHTGCGAVTAAVDAYLDHRNYPATAPLRSVVDKILPAVSSADHALREKHGAEFQTDPSYRGRLIDCAIVMNAALGAMTLRDSVGLTTVYGVFDLVSRKVELRDPPADPDGFVALAATLAGEQ